MQYCNIAGGLGVGDVTNQALLLQNVVVRKKTNLSFFSFLSFPRGRWRDKDVLSHSSLLKVSEDVYESAQPLVHSGHGFGSYYMSLPQNRGIFA